MKLADYLLQNPLYAYGQEVQQQGSQTTPVRSWQEGLARTLQGGLGGFFQGQALRQAKGEQTKDQQALQSAMTTYQTNPQAARSILGSRPNLADQGWQLTMLDAQAQKQLEVAKANMELQNKQRDDDYTRFFGGPPGGQQGATSPAPDPNNLGNLRPPGSNTGFQSFPTPQAGANALVGNLGAYVKANPNITVAQAIAQWAPPKENNTRAYQSNLAEDTGINPGMPLAEVLKDPAQTARLAEGITKIEKGRVPQGVNADTFMQAARPGQVPAPGAPQPQGQPQAPNAPAGPPAGDMINFQGLQLPRAGLSAAMMITDAKERQKALSDLVQTHLKQQFEGQPVERVRQDDGSLKLVPRAQSAGMTEPREMPLPGTPQGDVGILQKALHDPEYAKTPEYAASYAREAAPKQSQSGQIMIPDMTAYPKPVSNVNRPAGENYQIKDTPASQLEMTTKLAKQFNEIPEVQKFKVIAPMMSAAEDAMTRPNNVAADKNILQAYARILAPGSERSTPDKEIEALGNIGSLPEEVKKVANRVLRGGGMSQEEREKIMTEARSRFNAFKTAHDAHATTFSQWAEELGLNPNRVLQSTMPEERHEAAPISAPHPNAPVLKLNE